ncbi:GntR family transcriptional regulator [Nesterenkonia muleiensis]|uniref:GntR family transcriptional regulator n=1 Tax=Nesterenkonia muleiensis TaxID=2282648 RepID=UPI000E70B651|nr:GntR family transcriptional regulator [Nesterenkonia muleiensis]
MADPTVADIAAALAAEHAQAPDGDRIPGENQLAAFFGVTRARIRTALTLLEDRHLIRRVRGAGTFVNRPFDYVIAGNLPPSLTSTVTAAGGLVRFDLRDVVEVPAPADIAPLLGCAPEDPLMMTSRRSWINNRIATCGHVWFRTEVLPEAETALRTVDSLYETLRLAGYHPVRSRCRVSTALPPVEIEQLLELTKPAPVSTVETLSAESTTSAPLILSRSWMRPDAIRVTVEW